MKKADRLTIKKNEDGTYCIYNQTTKEFGSSGTLQEIEKIMKIIKKHRSDNNKLNRGIR